MAVYDVLESNGVPVNEYGEIVAQTGKGSNNYIGVISNTASPVSSKSSKLVIADMESFSSDINSEVEKIFKLKIKQMCTKTAQVVPETVPTKISGTRYYIDSIAGLDTNNGTSQLTPWKSLTKIMGLSPAVGSVISIANDSVFDTPTDSLATYLTKYANNGADNLRGTITQPIIIKPYYPRGVSDTLPVIRYYGVLAESDWTQEAGIGPNIWSFPYVSNWESARTRVYFGKDRRTGIAPVIVAGGQNSAQALYAEGQYAKLITDNKVYVYSPSNPTTYYGEVIITGRPIFSSFWQGGHYLKVRGLRFELCSGFNIENSSTVVVKGLEVSGCQFYKAILGNIDNACSNASPQEMEFSAFDNYFENCPSMGIRLHTARGTAGNTLSWEIYRNRMYGGNMGNGLGGGALLYTQATGGTKHIAWGNYGYDCRNGTGGMAIDGAMLYADVRSVNAIFYANIAERCAIPFQQNNVVGGVIASNLAVDCLIFSMITGAPDVNTPNQTYIQAHNTYLWTGKVKPEEIQTSAVGRNITSAVFYQANDNWYSFANKFTNYTCVNNLIVSLDPSIADRPAAQYDVLGITTASLLGFGVMGLRDTNSVIDKYGQGATVDKSLVEDVVSIRGSNSNYKTWLSDALDGVARVAPDSSLTGAGVLLSLQYKDITGKNFSATTPTIGCFEPLNS